MRLCVCVSVSGIFYACFGLVSVLVRPVFDGISLCGSVDGWLAGWLAALLFVLETRKSLMKAMT